MFSYVVAALLFHLGQVSAQDVTVVGSLDELVAAFDSGAAHIELVSHLYVDDWLIVPDTVQSLKANCIDDFPEFSEELLCDYCTTFPTVLENRDKQCMIQSGRGMHLKTPFESDHPQSSNPLWLDGIYLAGNGIFNIKRPLYATGVTLQGVGGSIGNDEHALFVSQDSLFKDVIITDFTALHTTIGVNLDAKASFVDSSIRDIQVMSIEWPAMTLFLRSAEAVVRLENVDIYNIAGTSHDFLEYDGEMSPEDWETGFFSDVTREIDLCSDECVDPYDYEDPDGKVPSRPLAEAPDGFLTCEDPWLLNVMEIHSSKTSPVPTTTGQMPSPPIVAMIDAEPISRSVDPEIGTYGEYGENGAYGSY